MPVVIKVRENGPFAIDITSGDFILVDHNDQPIPIPPLKPGKTNVTLCRCGLSRRLPYCDGSHSPPAEGLAARWRRFARGD